MNYPIRRRLVHLRKSRSKLAVGVLATAALIIVAAISTSAFGAGGLGKPNKATKSPIVFGMINLEQGPVTFPEFRAGAQAGINYVNQYLGGLKGHPIKLLTCATDGTPATSARCANQLAAKHVVAMLGATDTGGGGSYPVFGRNKLSVIGGVPFTPVESNAKNGVMFLSAAVADNAAATVYAVKTLHKKSLVILAGDNTQGNYTASIVANVAKNLGIKNKTVEVPITAADLSPSAASAIAANPDVIFVETPEACAPMLKALKAVGYKGLLYSIDPCAAPPVLAAAGPAAQGMIIPGAYYELYDNNPQAKLSAAILSKFAPKNTALDSLAVAGLSEIINLQTASKSLPANKLNSAGLLAFFKNGKQHPNWMGHAMVCDGKQVPAQSASCDKWMRIYKVSGTKLVPTSNQWVSGAQYYKP
jgi:branched-chain amino acid transport system substrate-binding protein